ncbi:MAG: lamin tail domain-containing protein, partial [Planctomycetota bacterium]
MVRTGNRGCVLRWILAASAAAGAAARAQDVAITEIHYAPTPEQGEAEFVEVTNRHPLSSDLSGFSLLGGIAFVFPEKTAVGPHGCVVVARNPARLVELAGLDPALVLGPFAGRLANEGEELVLANPAGRAISRVRYNNRGRWPVEAAGGGHTLELRAPHLDPSRRENWRASRRPLGNPGRIGDPPRRSALVPSGAVWKWTPGREEPPTDWASPEFDDAAWAEGPGPFGYGRAGLATVLAGMRYGYASAYFRHAFALDEVPSSGRLVLRVDYDDGFVAYLNGAEIARSGLSGAPPPHDATAKLHSAGVPEEFEAPLRLLAAGANVLAIQGHNSSAGSDDFVLAPELLLEEADEPSPVAIDGVSFGPELLPGERWVAIRNESGARVSLAGLELAPDGGLAGAFAFPPGSALGAGERVVLRDLPFPLDEPRLKLFLWDRGRTRVLAALDLDAPRGRRGHLALFPGEGLREGEREWLFVPGLEPQAERRRPERPAVVLSEIHYRALDPLGDPDEEYVELHNFGATPADLSGFRFVEGISFDFPAGTRIGPGGHLVVARNPEALSALHGLSGVLGPFSGALRNRGELLELADADGNPVDSVRYADGGAWPRDADGGGSSLERVDPRAPSDAPSSWAASLEAEKSEWTRFEYTGRHTSGEPEIHVLLLQSGSCLVDDVSVKADGVEHVPNGGFEDGLAPWIADGTHIHSHVTEDDARSGRRSLRILAYGRGDTGANHIEVETNPPLQAGKTYTVSLWARWERGTTLLMTRSYNQGLAKAHRLSPPERRGTPGAPNSVARNAGPAIDRLEQRPILPRPGAPVLFRA